MPLYEYRCIEGHRLEVLHKIAEPGPDTCECGAVLERVLSAPAIRFNGPGFHNTDYGVGPRKKVTTA